MPIGIAGILMISAITIWGSFRTNQIERREMERLKQVYQVPVK